MASFETAAGETANGERTNVETGKGGVLYLVVGPSGVGKDTLMAEARSRLDGTHHFVRRVVTRPSDAGGEDHDSVSQPRFAELVSEGAFSLEWSAHCLRYGIRSADTARLLEGVHVVANVSRAIVDAARRSFPLVRIVHVTASPTVLRGRLQARGRETGPEIEARLARAAAAAPSGPDVVTVRNDGSLEAALQLFVAALGSAQAGAGATSSLQ